MDPKKPSYHISTETTIDPNDATEIRRWSEELGVPEEQVREAIREAGPRFGDVEHALGRRFFEEHRSHSTELGGRMPGRGVPADEGGEVEETNRRA